MMHKVKAAAVLLLATRSAALPNCESETEANCLGEDADLSPEGIDACVAAVADKSADCSKYLELVQACKADISGDGVCAAAAGDGEAMPCILQRTKPEALSAACQAALPKSELKGLAKFWADGKRQLNINEIADLNTDDKDTYNRWQKKKKGKKTDKDRERDYAVKAAKRERTIELIGTAVKEAVSADAEPSMAKAIEVATKQAKVLLDEDMTGTLKPFTKTELEGIARDAYKKTMQAKKEL